MRPPAAHRIALGLLERFGGGVYDEALCGDLLEEFARTGSAWRFWREMGAAMLRGVWRRSAEWVRPVCFSAGWSVFYPVWRGSEPVSVAQAVAARVNLLPWPFSSLLLLADAGVPALLFVWLGFLLYAARDRMRGRAAGRGAVVKGLSLSSSVLLLSSVAVMARLSGEGLDVRLLGTAGFPNAEARYAMSVPVALGVLAATLIARPARRLMSRRSV